MMFILIIVAGSIGWITLDIAEQKTERIMLIGDCVHEMNGHDAKMDYRQAWTVYGEQCANSLKK